MVRYIASLLSALALLLPSHAGGQELLKERIFEGDALYGFMNGGSDLYFEYGFQKLTVKDLQYEGYKYTMEIYRMDTPRNAFGIYSIHIFKPLRVDSLVPGGFDCLSKYQLQAVSEDEYISIVFNDGEKASMGAEKMLVQYLRAKNDLSDSGEGLGCRECSSTRKVTPGIFPSDVLKLERPYSGRLRYINGEIALSQTADDVYDEYPGIGPEYGLWIYSTTDGENIYIRQLN